MTSRDRSPSKGKDGRRLSVSFATSDRPGVLKYPNNDDGSPIPIAWIRCAWVDFAGLVRFKIVTKASYEKACLNPPQSLIVVTAAVLSLGHEDTIGNGFGPVGDLYLQPDKNSFRPLPYEPGQAMVMCNILRRREVSEFSSPRVDASGVPETVLSAYPLCPRMLLSTTLHTSVSEYGVAYLIGFEIELSIVEVTLRDGQLVPVDAPRSEHSWCRASAMRSGSKGYEIVKKIVHVLEDAGIMVEQWHAESGTSTFEIVLAPHAPFQACDELIFAREAAYNVASLMDARCTFTPKPFAAKAGCGSHVHISLHRRKKSTPTSSPGPPAPFPSPSSRPLAMSPVISVLESRWLAGVLHHLPAILAFTLPSSFSYDRVGEGNWSGGIWVAWGTANKETPIRLCSNGQSEHNFEIKTMDATSNVYLALSAILTSGLLGIQTPLDLSQPDCRVDPAKMTSNDRAVTRITTQLPRKIEESLVALEKDQWLTKSLGSVFCRAYTSIKKGEAERYQKLTEAQRKKFTVEQV